MAPAVHKKYASYNKEVKWPPPRESYRIFVGNLKTWLETTFFGQVVELGLENGLHVEVEYIRINAEPFCTEHIREIREELIRKTREEPTREEHSCENCGVHYGEYQDESHAKEAYTEILSMLPREVRMEEPDMTCVEKPLRTQ